MIEFDPPINRLYTTEDVADMLDVEPEVISQRCRRRKIGQVMGGRHGVRLLTEVEVQAAKKGRYE